MESVLITRLKMSLLDIWNERDNNRRIQAIESIYVDNSRFFEQEEVINGHNGLNEFINKLHAQFPADFKFTVLAAHVNHNAGRLSWEFGQEGQPAAVTGMDLVIFEGDYIKDLYVFIDAPATN
jgi:hypothetical protein